MQKLVSDSCVLDLVEHIYAAGCDPAEWPVFVKRVHSLLPGAAFNVLLSIKGTEISASSASAGIAEEHLRSYFAHYQFINPYTSLFAKIPIGQVRTIGEEIDRRWVKRQVFYEEWLKPAGQFTHGAGVTLARDDRRLLRVTIDIPEPLGDIEEPAAALLKRLAPHLVRAFAVNESLAAAVATRQALSLVVDNLDAPAGILTTDGRVIILNAGAEALVRRGTLVRSGMDSRLVFRNPGYDETFRRILASACDTSSADGMSGFAAIDPAGVSRHVIVLPLRPNSTLAVAAASRSMALIVFRDDAGQVLAPTRILQALYGLTRSEALIAADVAAGLSPAETAEKHGISRATARNQLGSAMAKMGVHRQAEVATTVLALAPRLGILNGGDDHKWPGRA